VDAGAPPQSEAMVQKAVQPLAKYFERVGMQAPTACEPPYAPDFSAQIEAVLNIRPTLLSCHLGLFSEEIRRAAKARGILLAGSATHVEEAIHLQEAGFDMVIAQGAEAGGHRGTFIGKAEDHLVGSFALTRLIAKRVHIPVVAAGGIMDGAGVMAALTLGASAAQLGTAFLNTRESLCSAVHRQQLTKNQYGDCETALTRAFSGRTAQGIGNELMQDMEGRMRLEQWQPLPFPAQNKLTGPLRAAGAKASNASMISLWAGQAHSLTRSIDSNQLVASLLEEMKAEGYTSVL
jgi:nitronate monooxygenase